MIQIWQRLDTQINGHQLENLLLILQTKAQAEYRYIFWVTSVLTGMQLEQQLDGEVVEVTTVLDNLDERSQATLAGCESGDGNGRVELSNHWERNATRQESTVRNV